MAGHQLARLSELGGERRGVIRQFTGQIDLLRRLSALGFSLGTDICVLRNPRHGPMLVVVRDTRVALARDVAGGILVQEASA